MMVTVSDIVAMTATSGGSDWLVGSDGRVVAFGAAKCDGSLGGGKLNNSIVAATGSSTAPVALLLWRKCSASRDPSSAKL
jgi:hypothetical protein